MAFSCDSFVCMKDETEGGFTALCKNSDRHPNETHEVVIVPEVKIDDSTTIECTYVTVSPPKSYSHRCLLAKPVWMWGAEMGSNDAGVCIANEAAFSNTDSSTYSSQSLYGYNKEEKELRYLTGMDLLRLALMFGDSALDAVKIIDHYLQHYEQGGCMQWMNIGINSYYSTYLVADYNEVWIVETINQWFVAKKYTHGIHAISNRYSLSAPFDMISKTLRDYCDDKGIDWKHDLDLYNTFGRWKESYFSDSYNRQCYVKNTLQQISLDRKLNINDFANILRSHEVRYPSPDEDEQSIHELKADPDECDHVNRSHCPNGINQGLLGMDICAHASYGPVRGSNTTGSLMCIMRKDGSVINFVTGTSAPCISVFKPVYIGCSVPKSLGVQFRNFRNGNFVNLSRRHRNGGSSMIQTFDKVLQKKKGIRSTASLLVYNQKASDLWWKHEELHRLYLQYFVSDEKYNKCIKHKISKFEKEMFKQLVQEYKEQNATQISEEEITALQQQIMDTYWKRAYQILDEIIKKTKGDIVSINSRRNRFELATIFASMNVWAMLTKYLHETQWAYWNKLAGIDVSNASATSQGKLGSLLTKAGNLLHRVYTFIAQLFQFDANNGVVRWIKLIVTSVWSVILLAIGWKMLN